MTFLEKEMAVEAQEAQEECGHTNTEQDDNNITFCVDCGKELYVEESY